MIFFFGWPGVVVGMILHGTNLEVDYIKEILLMILYYVATTWLMRALFVEINLVPLDIVRDVYSWGQQ